jgi:hypothetical protein
MSCRIAEEIAIVPVIAPVAQTAAGNTTGAYLVCPPKLGTVDFVVRSGALAAGKKLTVEVFQAKDTSGTGAAELPAYETVFTAPEGGATDNSVIVSVDSCDVTDGFVTVKVTNDAASAVPLDAFAMIRKPYLD